MFCREPRVEFRVFFPCYMKVKVVVKIGKKRRNFEIPIGRGDKTFKWLGSVASQMYSSDNPEGTLRTRDNFRGLTRRSQHTASDVLLSNGEIPHPMSLLHDYVMDGDVLFCHIAETMVTGADGLPVASTFSTLANINSQDAPMYIDDSNYLEDDSEAMFDTSSGEGLVSRNSRMKDQLGAAQSAGFMKVVMASQMYDVRKMKDDVDLYWKTVARLMPHLSESNTVAMKGIFTTHFSVISLLFDHHAEPLGDYAGQLGRLKFKEMIHTAKIFKSDKDFEPLTTRIFRRVSNNDALTFIGIGPFLAALILVAESRHHNTFDPHSEIRGAERSLNSIVGTNLGKLASHHRLRIRDLLYKNERLAQMRTMYDQLFELFEKYAARSGRVLSTSLPVAHMAELLMESGILVMVAVDEDDKENNHAMSLTIAKDLMAQTRNGYILGRHSIPAEQRRENDLPEPPAEDYLFPEFLEAIARATFYLIDPDEEIMFEEDHMMDGYTKAIRCLREPEPEVVSTLRSKGKH